jgi:hypothetical protein
MFLAELAEETWYDLAAVLGRYVDMCVCGGVGGGEAAVCTILLALGPIGPTLLTKVVLKHVYFAWSSLGAHINYG